MLGPDEFRLALSQFASGITVVTTRDAGGQPTGLTASAFTAVSLSPPLVLVCVGHAAQCHPALLESGRFAVNILAEAQAAVSRRFATSSLEGAQKFDGVPTSPGDLGLPLLDGALAALECSTVHAYPGGDHTIFVGRVDAARVAPVAGPPLLYFRGQYGRLDRQETLR